MSILELFKTWKDEATAELIYCWKPDKEFGPDDLQRTLPPSVVLGKLCDDNILDLFRKTKNIGINLAGYTLLPVDFILLLIERDIINEFIAPAML